ncbi:hypothetical protein L529_3171 [Bordetella bronchiseptica MBORD901]|nr:hypothetical protein L529_3171 [Bordetella bronchiseptica MBORD901]
MFLDRWQPWRLYRDMQAIRFLALATVLLRQRGNIDTRLRTALLVQGADAPPWLAWHLERMLLRVDAGVVDASVFDTGLFEPAHAWFMADMVAAHGLADGLARARTRVEAHMLPRLRRQAQGLRWALLLGAVGAVLALALWHYAAIDDLRRALVSFYASQ